MAGIALVAAREARRIVRSEIQLSLMVYRNPEIEDRYLTLRVRSAGYGDTLREAIRAVQNRMTAEFRSSSGWLHIGTDYRPPSWSLWLLTGVSTSLLQSRNLVQAPVSRLRPCSDRTSVEHTMPQFVT
jgi:hypothetical protein